MYWSFVQSVTLETSTLYSIGVVIIGLRFAARCYFLSGPRGLKIDDAITFMGLIWYTLLMASINLIARGGGSNYMTPKQIAALTPQTTKDRIKGSKWAFAMTHFILCTIWSMKTCMIILYLRISEGTSRHKYVRILAVFIGLSFVVAELAAFLGCRPLNQYWAVPSFNPQCFRYKDYEFVEASMNIPGDIAMLVFSIPLMASLKLPARKKAIPIFLFSLGALLVVAAILRKLFCIVPALISNNFLKWYFREGSISVYITNLPPTWPLVRAAYGSVFGWTSQSEESDASPQRRSTTLDGQKFETSRSRYLGLQYQKSAGFEPGESQEYINKQEAADITHEDNIHLEILRKTTVSIKTTPKEDGDLERAIAPR